MSRYYPTKDEVTRDPLTNDISMNKDSFSLNFRKMFPAERVFISYVQLREAVKIFFRHWNLLCKSSSCTLRCSYSHVTRAKKNVPIDNTQHPDINAKRNAQKPIAVQVQCPFELKWSLLEYNRPRRNQIFYKAKVSNLISTEHTCMMSHMLYRTS